MLAMWPPGRASRVASSKVSGTPTASMATSAPSPPVSSRTTARGSSRPLLTTMSAPNCLAASSRLSARSMATTWAGLKSRAPIMAERPMGPAPDDGDHVAGRTWPLSTPTSYPVGRMSASMRMSSSADPVGHGVGRGVGERDPDVLGLGAVDLVAEDPAAAAEALAVAAFAAVAARPAGGDAGHEDPVADGDVLHPGADGLDGADGLVAEDPPVGDGGDVALQDVQVRAADRHGVDPHDGVGVVDDRRAWGPPPRPSGRDRGTRLHA